MVLGKPAPFVSAFVNAVDEAIRAHNPATACPPCSVPGLRFVSPPFWSPTPSAGHALHVPASAAIRWQLCPGCFATARFPGTSSWWRVYGSSCATMACTLGLVIDDTDNKRSKAAHTLAHLYKLHDKESGGYVWGQSLVFLVLVTPKISIPVGFAFYQPAPELSAWYKQEKALKKQGVPKKQRPTQPPANPLYPTKQALALSLLAQFQTQHPDVKVNCITADALYGTAPFVDGASAMFGGVQVISQIRSNQKVRLHKREQNVSDYFATHPGTPHTIRIRGGQEVVAIVGSARLYVGAHKTKRFVVALKYEGEDAYRF